MSEAKVADTKPAVVDLEGGKDYYWCACGHSANQPFCDGSHKGTGIGPLPFKQDDAGTAYLCQCKKTGKSPYCDGAHTQL